MVLSYPIPHPLAHFPLPLLTVLVIVPQFMVNQETLVHLVPPAMSPSAHVVVSSRRAVEDPLDRLTSIVMMV